MNNLAINAKRYFSKLSKNNNKMWFDSHREEYDKYILEPSKEFVLDLGTELKKMVPKLIVDPRVNKSLFRINRDIRFSNDKTPYKTHLALFLWEGAAPKMECPGFYLHIDSKEISIGAGIYRFSKTQLSGYRDIVGRIDHNNILSKILDNIIKKGFIVGGEHYKRIKNKTNLDIQAPNLLLHNGLYVSKTLLNNNKLPELKELCLSGFRDALKLHRWFVKHEFGS